MPRITAAELAECVKARQDNYGLTGILIIARDLAEGKDDDREPEERLEEIARMARFGLEQIGELATVALDMLPEPDTPGTADLAAMMHRLRRRRAGLPELAIAEPDAETRG